MALTFTKVSQGAWQSGGSLSEAFWDITFDNSYPAGGYAVSGNNFGLSNNVICISPLTEIACMGVGAQGGAYAGSWDLSTKKFRIYQGAVGIASELAGASAAVLGMKCRVVVYGY